jgi:hypothetical protein
MVCLQRDETPNEPSDAGGPARPHWQLTRSARVRSSSLASSGKTTGRRSCPGFGCPDALGRKYPAAGEQWAWFWLWPSRETSLDPRSGLRRRHHREDIFSFRQDFQAAIWIGIQARPLIPPFAPVAPPSLIISGSRALVFEQEPTETTEENRVAVFSLRASAQDRVEGEATTK